MNNSRIPALKVSDDGVILNLNELLEVIKNTDVNSLSEEDFKEFENLYQTLKNDNNSLNKFTNEEELLDPLASLTVNYKVVHDKQDITSEQLLQTIKGNKDDAANLDIVTTKSFETDSGKDISYLTAVVDGKRDIIQITNDDVLKNYLAENAEKLNRLSSEELFKNIKEHVFKNLKFEERIADSQVSKTPEGNKEDYLVEMEKREINNMITKFNYPTNYRVATDENGERLYIVNNDVYKFKTEVDGKRTIYPIVKTSSAMEYTSDINPDISEEELKEEAQNEVDEIKDKKQKELDKEKRKVENSFETKPVEHSYTFNVHEYIDINDRLYAGEKMDSDNPVPPKIENLDEEELNLFYFDTNALVKTLPVLYEKSTDSENINQAVLYSKNFCKYLEERNFDSLNENEIQIINTYHDAMEKIEQIQYQKAVEAEEKENEGKLDELIDEVFSPEKEETQQPLVNQNPPVPEQQIQEENVDDLIANNSGEELSEDEYAMSPDVDEAAYAHPLPGQNGRVRRLGYPNQGDGTHGVALVLILLEIVAISILAIVFYNMMQ